MPLEIGGDAASTKRRGLAEKYTLFGFLLPHRRRFFLQGRAVGVVLGVVGSRARGSRPEFLGTPRVPRRRLHLLLLLLYFALLNRRLPFS